MQRIVLTGGPGAGKSAVASVIAKTLRNDVAMVPESATLVYSGGFPRSECRSIALHAQRAIFSVQKELESAVSARGMRTILCDRGTLDGLAYLSSGQEEFLQALGTSRLEELERYDAVVHLRVPSPRQGYDLSNPVRNETPAQAQTLDKKIAQIWSAHPKYFTVPAMDDFGRKLHSVTKIIRDLIRHDRRTGSAFVQNAHERTIRAMF